MAGSLNKVMLIGRLGADPEFRVTPNGSSVVNFNLATDESYKDKNGQKIERTEWHRIVAWDKLAEICKQYLTKGKLIYVEGKLTTRSWDDKETGKKNYITEIVATDMTMLESKGERSASSPPTASMPTEHVSEMAPPKASAPRPKPTPDMPPPEAKNDDLPF
jgi:single-strand DNA-binding protein